MVDRSVFEEISGKPIVKKKPELVTAADVLKADREIKARKKPKSFAKVKPIRATEKIARRVFSGAAIRQTPTLTVRLSPKRGTPFDRNPRLLDQNFFKPVPKRKEFFGKGRI